MTEKKNVALVLASGGSRGLAHIGAIEVLEEHGFRITSVAGASMGALVGGIYAAGGLDAFKEWMKTVDRMKVFNLMDFTIGNGGFVKGEKVIGELKSIIPDKLIENLPIPFTAVATDIRHRKEVVFDRGSLYDAIRSSISLPSIFTPNRIGDMLLIDGGVVNPVPVNRVVRTPGDILTAVDLNGPYIEKPEEKQEHVKGRIRQRLDKIVDTIADKVKKDEVEAHLLSGSENLEKEKEDDNDMGIVTILNESSSVMIQTNADLTLKLYPPDILVRIAKNAYSTMEFYKYDEIVALGRTKMEEALRNFR
ncbi:MAG TPA: patatin-like phospholipase family protein [Candidatus Coprenecus avistercoris]|uniref:Patatin-like phospholipase family protein n=1 Tax=Candidatus Coprenecus avistercoris TaxID=2840730 RepID=A0A9D1E2P0_9BACT|nr:patatin-like phospholipase family protein [Candidatus Coprenecus avistercoris]